MEKKLEVYKKDIELRDKQLAEAKKILKGEKNSYHSLLKENKQLKEYIANIKQRFQTVSTTTAAGRILTGQGIFSKASTKKV